MRLALAAIFALSATAASAAGTDQFDLVCHLKSGLQNRLAIDLTKREFCFKSEGHCGYVYPITALDGTRIIYTYDIAEDGANHVPNGFRLDHTLAFSPLQDSIVIDRPGRGYTEVLTADEGDVAAIRTHEMTHATCTTAPFTGVDNDQLLQYFQKHRALWHSGPDRK